MVGRDRRGVRLWLTTVTIQFLLPASIILTSKPIQASPIPLANIPLIQVDTGLKNASLLTRAPLQLASVTVWGDPVPAVKWLSMNGSPLAINVTAQRLANGYRMYDSVQLSNNYSVLAQNKHGTARWPCYCGGSSYLAANSSCCTTETEQSKSTKSIALPVILPIICVCIGFFVVFSLWRHRRAKGKLVSRTSIGRLPIHARQSSVVLKKDTTPQSCLNTASGVMIFEHCSSSLENSQLSLSFQQMYEPNQTCTLIRYSKNRKVTFTSGANSMLVKSDRRRGNLPEVRQTPAPPTVNEREGRQPRLNDTGDDGDGLEMSLTLEQGASSVTLASPADVSMITSLSCSFVQEDDGDQNNNDKEG